MSQYYDDINFKLHMVDGSTIIHSDKNREWEDHKYFTKVETSKGKYRYFYTKAEYDAYMREKAQKQSVEATKMLKVRDTWNHIYGRDVQGAQDARERAQKKSVDSTKELTERFNNKANDAQAARERAQKKSVDATRALNVRAAQDRAYGRNVQGSQEARERAQKKSVDSTKERTEKFNNQVNEAQAARERAQKQSVESTDTGFPREKLSWINQFDEPEKQTPYAKEASMWAMASNLASKHDKHDPDAVVVTATRRDKHDNYDQLTESVEEDVQYNLDLYGTYAAEERATIFNVKNPEEGYGRYNKKTGFWPMETKSFQPDDKGINKQLKTDLDKKLNADVANDTNKSSGIIKMKCYTDNWYPATIYLNYAYDNGKLTIYDPSKGKAVDSNNLYQYIRNNYEYAENLDLKNTSTMRTDDFMFGGITKHSFSKKIFSIRW